MQINKIIYTNIKAILPYLGFALIVLTIKLLIIANYSNATPFWDQWDAEADRLYRPLIEGNLTWADMLAGHNVHRIFTTRLLALALLYLNGGVWNPILQMQVNAGIHVFAIALLLFYTAKALTPFSRNALLIFCIIVFSIPFGWVNILQGFQSQFYLLLLFSFIFFWAMVTYKTYSVKWWLGFVAGLLCPLSLASGAFTLLAGSLILSIRYLFIENKHAVAITSIVLLLVLASMFIILTPTLPRHAFLKAHSVFQFFHALVTILSWPDRNFRIGIIVIHIPVLLVFYYTLRKLDYQTAPLFFIAAIMLWLFGQFIAIAYGRAVDNMASRYLDLFAIGLVINFAAIAILFDQANLEQKLFYAGFAGLWITITVFGFVFSIGQIAQDMKSKFNSALNQERNVRAYLCTGDFSYLQNKRLLDIPYPNAVRLKSLLDNLSIRSILPGNIYAPNSSNPKTFCNEYTSKKSLDSLNVANEYTPEKLLNSLKIAVAKTCIGNIDHINGNTAPKHFSISGTLNVNGWLAQSPTQNLPSTAIVVLTDNKGKNMFFNTQIWNRPDVATHFNNSALSSVGFKTTISVSSMIGNYTLSLGFVDGEVIKLCPQFKIPGTIIKE